MPQTLTAAGITEVNFRDERTLLGVGQAQARSELSAAPAFSVAAYGMLLVSARHAFGHSPDSLLPQPKWSATSKRSRISTQPMIHQLRAEVWGRGLGIESFSAFASNLPNHSNPEKCAFPRSPSGRSI